MNNAGSHNDNLLSPLQVFTVSKSVRIYNSDLGVVRTGIGRLHPNGLAETAKQRPVGGLERKCLQKVLAAVAAFLGIRSTALIGLRLYSLSTTIIE